MGFFTHMRGREFSRPEGRINSLRGGDSDVVAAVPALASLLPLTSAVGAAGAYIAIQACTRAGAPRSAIVLCFTGGNALIGGCAIVLTGDWRLLLAASSRCLLLLLLCGLFGFAAQLCLTSAIGLGSASTVAITMLSEVAFAFLLEAIAFGTHTSSTTALGAVLTTLGVLVAILLPASSSSSAARSDEEESSFARARSSTLRKSHGGFHGLRPEAEMDIPIAVAAEGEQAVRALP